MIVSTRNYGYRGYHGGRYGDFFTDAVGTVGTLLGTVFNIGGTSPPPPPPPPPKTSPLVYIGAGLAGVVLLGGLYSVVRR